MRLDNQLMLFCFKKKHPTFRNGNRFCGWKGERCNFQCHGVNRWVKINACTFRLSVNFHLLNSQASLSECLLLDVLILSYPPPPQKVQGKISRISCSLLVVKPEFWSDLQLSRVTTLHSRVEGLRSSFSLCNVLRLQIREEKEQTEDWDFSLGTHIPLFVSLLTPLPFISFQVWQFCCHSSYKTSCPVIHFNHASSKIVNTYC